MEVTKGNNGHALVFAALFLTIMLMFIALAINVGWLTYVKNQGQAAVDASALAAAAAIPNYNLSADPSQVYALAEGFNDQNTVMGGSADIVGNTDVEFCTGEALGSFVCESGPENPSQVGGVRVTKTYSGPIFLAGFLESSDAKDFTVSGTAWLGGPGGIRPSLPVALCSEQIHYDSTLTCDPSVETDFTPDKVDNAGWWTPFNVAASASECKHMVNNPGDIPFINVNDNINLNNGQITSCHNEVEKRFKDCTPTVCALDPEDEARKACTVILPIVDCPHSINQQQPVRGFAAMCVTNVVSVPASEATIDGTLRCDVQAEGSVGGGPQFGVYADHAVLVK